MNMKIIDTFIFSEGREKDLLLLKFILEDNAVDQWIIQESEYTTQGEHKGFSAEEVISSDDRFKPFLSKVKIISDTYLLHPGKTDDYSNFDRENRQRTLAIEYLLDTYTDEDRFMISDTDESIDFSDEDRKNRVFDYIKQHPNDIIHIGRMRYWYDFDNRSYIPCYRIPLVPIGSLRGNRNTIHCRYSNGITYDAAENPVAFEYSHCYRSVEEIYRKTSTCVYTQHTISEIEDGLRYNTWPRMTSLRGERVGMEPYDFFETVVLNEQNSPKYVRDNLPILKTNIVNPNYKEDRYIKYGVK